jgi:hypothetical protein
MRTEISMFKHAIRTCATVIIASLLLLLGYFFLAHTSRCSVLFMSLVIHRRFRY